MIEADLGDATSSLKRRGDSEQTVLGGMALVRVQPVDIFTVSLLRSRFCSFPGSFSTVPVLLSPRAEGMRDNRTETKTRKDHVLIVVICYLNTVDGVERH